MRERYVKSKATVNTFFFLEPKMKTLKLITLLAFVLMFAQCKSPTQVMQTSNPPSLLEVHTLLDSAQSRFLAYADQSGGDPKKAIELTTDWLSIQPNVQDAYSTDSLYITIILKSGLQTSFYFNPVDDSGISRYRGGGGGSSLLDNKAHSINSMLSAKKITNKKVLLFAAQAADFGLGPQLARISSLMTKAGLGLEVTVMKDRQCSYGVVETFKDYGLVILDTHGQKNSFLVGSVLDLPMPAASNEALKGMIDAEAGAGTAGKIESGSLLLSGSVKANPSTPGWQKSVIPRTDRDLWFSSKYLDLLPSMPNTIIFGNMCFSGWTSSTVLIPTKIRTIDGTTDTLPSRTITIDDPIATAFINRKLISYYGYARDMPAGTSRVVSDDFAKQMEDSIVHRFVENVDSTKIAHLQADNVTEYADPAPLLSAQVLDLRHFGADDFSYVKCGNPLTDTRDGQVYQTVCIDDQMWMAQNLNFDAPGSVCYNDNPANCSTYGKLYDWNTLMAGSLSSNSRPSKVKGVCPNGWHVPSDSEWMHTIAFLGGGASAASAMMKPGVWNNFIPTTNTSGFSALAGGLQNGYGLQLYSELRNGGHFWTSTALSDSTATEVAFYDATSPQVERGSNLKPAALSCRCMKDP
jgi:uncharacterized protein (TIGR02145 family)